MTRFTARVLGLCGCLLLMFGALPVQADPFFVTVYGRTYKVDPRLTSNAAGGPKPREVMQALPSDIAGGPGFKPSHEQVLAEVEERTWIARNLLADELAKSSFSRGGRYAGADLAAAEPETTGSLANGAAQAREPALQTLYDRHMALHLLARELRRSMDLPATTPEAGFSRPKLPPEIEASYRDLNLILLQPITASGASRQPSGQAISDSSPGLPTTPCRSHARPSGRSATASSLSRQRKRS